MSHFGSILSHFEPFWVILSHFEPLGAILTPFEPHGRALDPKTLSILPNAFQIWQQKAPFVAQIWPLAAQRPQIYATRCARLWYSGRNPGSAPPGGGGGGRAPGANMQTHTKPAISGNFLTQNGQKIDFFGVKKWSKNGPKMTPKWSKNGPKRHGVHQKIPKNPKKIPQKSKKWPKTAPQSPA